MQKSGEEYPTKKEGPGVRELNWNAVSEGTRQNGSEKAGGRITQALEGL